MGAMLSTQMAKASHDAAVRKLTKYQGKHAEKAAKAAAKQACHITLKRVAKALATRMAIVASTQKKSRKLAMRKAIVTVLQVGRPLESNIIANAVNEALSAEIAQRKRRFPSHAPKQAGQHWPTTGGKKPMPWPQGHPAGEHPSWPSDEPSEVKVKKARKLALSSTKEAREKARIKAVAARATKIKLAVAEKKAKERATKAAKEKHDKKAEKVSKKKEKKSKRKEKKKKALAKHKENLKKAFVKGVKTAAGKVWGAAKRAVTTAANSKTV